MKTYCGAKECIGHGDYLVCGDPDRYEAGEKYQCAACQLVDEKNKGVLMKVKVNGVVMNGDELTGFLAALKSKGIEISFEKE